MDNFFQDNFTFDWPIADVFFYRHNQEQGQLPGANGFDFELPFGIGVFFQKLLRRVDQLDVKSRSVIRILQLNLHDFGNPHGF